VKASTGSLLRSAGFKAKSWKAAETKGLGCTEPRGLPVRVPPICSSYLTKGGQGIAARGSRYRLADGHERHQVKPLGRTRTRVASGQSSATRNTILPAP
jgi:hypothetical protein